jgi:uncharacterized damage-inducible protein DinB
MPTNAQTRRGAAVTARSLTERNIAILAQGRDLLARLTDDEYVAAAPSGLRGGVGPHFRHVLDHYELFLAGCAGQVVDYDVRKRETSVERDRGAALAKLGEVVGGLLVLAEVDAARALLVKVDSGEADERFEGASSIGRELQFLVSHTVHHYAVIAVMLRARGIDPGRDFGVAPSTLKHEAGTQACAR